MTFMEEQAQEEKTIATVAAGVAKAMTGWTFKAGESGHWQEITFTEGRAISINKSWHGKNRLNISGVYPRDKGNECYGRRAAGYRNDTPSITVARDRDPKSIAAEIVRRLIPEYFTLYTKAVELKANCDAYEARITANIERFKTLTGISKCDKNTLHYNGDNCGYGDVIIHESSVEFKLSNLSLDTAERIARLLKDIIKSS